MARRRASDEIRPLIRNAKAHDLISDFLRKIHETEGDTSVVWVSCQLEPVVKGDPGRAREFEHPEVTNDALE